jgi:hypothetical protein
MEDELKTLNGIYVQLAIPHSRADVLNYANNLLKIEQAIKRQYGLDRQEPPAQAGKTA